LMAVACPPYLLHCAFTKHVLFLMRLAEAELS
jgi:hypothetical protein